MAKLRLTQEQVDRLMEVVDDAQLSEEQNDKPHDACYRKVKSRYKVFPSAYAGGALVNCRNVGAANWGNKSESIDYNETEASSVTEEMDEAKKTDYSKEKSQGLHGWFSRRGGGGSKGWVDCNTCRKNKSGRKTCKACGRQPGEKRKYPACRPTPASCGTPKKGKKWGKKSNESLNEELLSIKNIMNMLGENVSHNKVICDRCGWSWDKKDGGDDLYTCHKCGHDNTPN